MFNKIELKHILLISLIIGVIVYYIYTPKPIKVSPPVFTPPIGEFQQVNPSGIPPPKAQPAPQVNSARIVPQMTEPINPQPVVNVEESKQIVEPPQIVQSVNEMSNNPDNSMINSQFVRQHLKSGHQNVILNNIMGGRV
jgi:hypothetical protein